MQRSWDKLQEPDPVEIALREQLNNLCEIHGRRMSDEARRHWMRRLTEMHQTYRNGVIRALDAACDSRSFFELEWIRERAEQENRRDTRPFVAPAEPTEVERHRADLAAIKSLLWLHYRHGWDLERIGRETLGRAFASQRGIDPADVPAVIAAAKESYPRETILRWMDDQQQIGA